MESGKSAIFELEDGRVLKSEDIIIIAKEEYNHMLNQIEIYKLKTSANKTLLEQKNEIDIEVMKEAYKECEINRIRGEAPSWAAIELKNRFIKMCYGKEIKISR